MGKWCSWPNPSTPEGKACKPDVQGLQASHNLRGLDQVFASIGHKRLKLPHQQEIHQQIEIVADRLAIHTEGGSIQ